MDCCKLLFVHDSTVSFTGSYLCQSVVFELIVRFADIVKELIVDFENVNVGFSYIICFPKGRVTCPKHYFIEYYTYSSNLCLPQAGGRGVCRSKSVLHHFKIGKLV